MKQIKKCIVVVSNLIGSVAIDCKVIKFNDAAYNPEIMILLACYLTPEDHNLLANAAYMKLLK